MRIASYGNDHSLLPWIQSTAPRISYGVISVRPPFPLYTVTFVTYIYVKTVWRNIALMNPKNTTLCLLICEGVHPSVQNIPKNIVFYTVNNVIFQFVHSVFPQVYTINMILPRFGTSTAVVPPQRNSISFILRSWSTKRRPFYKFAYSSDEIWSYVEIHGKFRTFTMNVDRCITNEPC